MGRSGGRWLGRDGSRSLGGGRSGDGGKRDDGQEGDGEDGKRRVAHGGDRVLRRREVEKWGMRRGGWIEVGPRRKNLHRKWKRFHFGQARWEVASCCFEWGFRMPCGAGFGGRRGRVEGAETGPKKLPVSGLTNVCLLTCNARRRSASVCAVRVSALHGWRRRAGAWTGESIQSGNGRLDFGGIGGSTTGWKRKERLSLDKPFRKSV